MDLASVGLGIAIGVVVVGVIALFHYYKTLMLHVKECRDMQDTYEQRITLHETLNDSLKKQLLADADVRKALEEYNIGLKNLADKQLQGRLDTITAICEILKSSRVKLEELFQILEVAKSTGTLIDQTFADQLIRIVREIRSNHVEDSIAAMGNPVPDSSDQKTVKTIESETVESSDEEGHY